MFHCAQHLRQYCILQSCDPLMNYDELTEKDSSMMADEKKIKIEKKIESDVFMSLGKS